VGSNVILRKDNGDHVDTTVANEAYILGGHTAVAHFNGVSGCYGINRVVGGSDEK